MQLRIRSITYLAEDVNGYELVDPNGHDLPRFAAGAHVGVRLGDAGREGVWRDYSLWNDPAERRRYCIAVLREGEGSRRLHDEIRVGDTLAGFSVYHPQGGIFDFTHTEIDEAFPDFFGMGFVAVEHAAHDFRRALVGQEFANLLLEQLLVVGEIEVHDGEP